MRIDFNTVLFIVLKFVSSRSVDNSVMNNLLSRSNPKTDKISKHERSSSIVTIKFQAHQIALKVTQGKVTM